MKGRNSESHQSEFHQVLMIYHMYMRPPLLIQNESRNNRIQSTDCHHPWERTWLICPIQMKGPKDNRQTAATIAPSFKKSRIPPGPLQQLPPCS